MKTIKVWMHWRDLSMFVNEQPEGGFKWSFLDYDPKDGEYVPVHVAVSTPASREGDEG